MTTPSLIEITTLRLQVASQVAGGVVAHAPWPRVEADRAAWALDVAALATAIADVLIERTGMLNALEKAVAKRAAQPPKGESLPVAPCVGCGRRLGIAPGEKDPKCSGCEKRCLARVNVNVIGSVGAVEWYVCGAPKGHEGMHERHGDMLGGVYSA